MLINKIWDNLKYNFVKKYKITYVQKTGFVLLNNFSKPPLKLIILLYRDFYPCGRAH
jgi:hypothetical protein